MGEMAHSVKSLLREQNDLYKKPGLPLVTLMASELELGRSLGLSGL